MRDVDEYMRNIIEYRRDIIEYRGAEAGGILGVNTPHFFGLTTPTFWRDLKMGAGERRSKS